MSQRLVPHAGASRVELPKPGIYMAGEWAYRPVGTRAWSSENQLEVTLGLSKEAIMIYEFPLNQSRIRHWKTCRTGRVAPA